MLAFDIPTHEHQIADLRLVEVVLRHMLGTAWWPILSR
jgi:hypothetical protein